MSMKKKEDKTMDSECLYCKLLFKHYEEEVDCLVCDEGTEEVEAEFGEGSYFRSCKTCNGKGTYKIIQTSFCCDNCRMEYIEDQYE